MPTPAEKRAAIEIVDEFIGLYRGQHGVLMLKVVSPYISWEEKRDINNEANGILVQVEKLQKVRAVLSGPPRRKKPQGAGSTSRDQEKSRGG